MNQEVTVIDGMSPATKEAPGMEIPVDDTPIEPEKEEEVKVEKLEFTEITDDDLPDDPENESLEEKEEKEEEKEEKEEEEEEEESYSQVELDKYTSKQDQIQSKLVNMATDIQRFAKVLEAPRPQAPSDEYDDVATRRYENKLIRWEERREEAIEEVKDLQATQKKLSFELGDSFKSFHKHDKELEDFEKFIVSKNVYYLALYTGEESIEDLYDMWKIKTARKGKKAIGVKKVVEKAKPKPISTKGSGSTKLKGVSRQYKYASMPMFKGYASDLKKQKTDIKGNPMTLKYIDDLCKQEYKLLKGQSLI